jgi:hypothetical protein
MSSLLSLERLAMAALAAAAVENPALSCQSPPVAGRKRCRVHGGLSPGAPRGSRNGNYRRGDWTPEAIEERRWLRSLVQAFAKTGTGRVGSSASGRDSACATFAVKGKGHGRQVIDRMGMMNSRRFS